MCQKVYGSWDLGRRMFDEDTHIKVFRTGFSIFRVLKALRHMACPV